MWLHIGNTHAKVVNATEQERAWLDDYLAFKDDRSIHRARLYGGDNRLHLYSRLTESFPAGFLQLVKQRAADEGFKVELVDQRQAPCTRDPQADLSVLRDYQLAAVEAVIKRTRGIIWVPTGGGKTHILVGLTRALPCRWLMLVHRTTLVEQAAARYEQLTGLPAGRVGEGSWATKDCWFVAATFQTLHRALMKRDPRVVALLQGARALAVDEAHTVPAESFYQVTMATPNAHYRVGLSGTPLARGDRRSVLAIAALGPVIYRIKPEVLISAGVLARPHIRMVPVVQQSDKPTWQGVYGEAIVRSPERNRLVVEAVKRAEKPCMVFVKEIKHGVILRKLLEKAGFQANFVYERSSTEQRQRAVRDLESGRLDVLVASVVFQEGVDIPALRSVVIASGGKSIIAALQRVGRGMRTAAGKDVFEVYDIADQGCGCKEKARREELGLIDSHNGCKWLDRHTRERVHAYTAEGYQTTFDHSFMTESVRATV